MHIEIFFKKSARLRFRASTSYELRTGNTKRTASEANSDYQSGALKYRDRATAIRIATEFRDLNSDESIPRICDDSLADSLPIRP